jgi:hypothetical protein
VAAADGYWIWTDWYVPEGFAGSKQDWIDAMMVYWAEANAALDRGDWTWAARQPIQVANPEATDPAYIVTVRNIAGGGEIVIWDPSSGVELVAFGAAPDAPNVAIACGDVLEAQEGDEIVATTANGAVRIYRPRDQEIIGGFDTDEFAGEGTAIVAVDGGHILLGGQSGRQVHEYKSSGELIGTACRVGGSAQGN